MSLVKTSSIKDRKLSHQECSSDGHVHFAESAVTPDHAGEINVSLSPDKQHADVHLGFLQLNNRYSIDVVIPVNLGSSVQMAKLNPYLTLKAARPHDSTSYEVTLELLAHHDKLLNESLELEIESEKFELMLSARVLGPGKGTPALKRGIKCIALADEESELSDFSSKVVQKRRSSKGNLTPVSQEPETASGSDP